MAPLMANGLFAVFISPQAPVNVPGAPFFLGSVLCLVALLLARRQSSRAKDGEYSPEGSDFVLEGTAA